MEKASKKPGLKKASGLGSSAPHVVPNKPLQMQKRKREHDGEGSESMRKGGKRTKMVHNQSDIAQADQTKGAEKAQVAPLRGPGDGKGNGDEVLEAQNMKRIETSDTKLAKRERRKRKRESKAVQEFDDGKDQLARTKSAGNLTEESQQFGKDTALVEKKHNKEEQSTKNESSWKMSEPIGGSFIDAEPLFSVDENYLLLAKASKVEIYSTSTSLLVRSLFIGYQSSISGYAFSAMNSQILYVSTFSGSIYKWDWVEGKKLARWNVSSQIINLATAASTNSGSDEDIVYTVDKKGKWMITAHKLLAGDKASKTELITLYRSQQSISGLKVVEGGQTLIATSGNRLILGARNSSVQESLTSTTYVWREVALAEWITSFDVRVPVKEDDSAGVNLDKLKSRGAVPRSSIDIVAGGAKGAIYIYTDILDKLIQKERPNKNGKVVDLTASIQHWHREAVSTVKWSLDGNYLISGGSETVLVLWQLDTGKKQFLPHLSSVIESVVVSSSGSSYALRLADNSAMVLSTSELKPTASIAGIQYHPQSRCRIPQPITKTVDSLNKNKDSLHSQSLHSASAFNPLNPNQLLLAVSASQSTYSDSIPTNRLTYLQTFDLATTHHISRQALTRTNTTTVNIGPDGGKIGEPNVRHLRVSHDGQWLATVDEWCPPAKDIDFLSVSEDFKEEEQRKRLEVYLKFWSWNSETKEWQLVSRVDWPHDSTSADSSGAGKVLSLVADPSAVAFASYGEDGVVRFWRPRLRRRNGIEVLGKNAEGLISWYCRHMVQLRNPARERTLADVSPRASMAFSEDGSLLTVSEQGSTTDKTGVVHFIDALSGQIRQFREGLYDGNLVDMGIVDRYLIILSEQLIVWDMVHDQLHFGLSLESYRLSSQDWVAASHLAVDRIRQTFAIALPIKGSKGHKSATQSEDKFQSEMTIFDPSQPNPLYTTSLPHTVTSILSTEGSKGYIVLDSAAEVRIISPKSMPFLSDLVVADSYTQSPRGLENVYGHNKMDGITLKIDDNNVSEAESNVVTPRYTSSEPRPDVYDDDDVPVVSQQQLASIFDVGPAFAMPPVEELFEQVAGLFAKKPRTLS